MTRILICCLVLAAGCGQPRAAPAPAKPAGAGIESDAVAPAAPGEQFVASRDRQVFHRPSCKWAQRITPAHRVVYASRAEARRAGKRPCAVCNP